MKSMDWKAITCWLLLLTLVVIHQWKLWGWQVDDAAISFGYARNWADGHGLVAFVGQERVEGYSNPLWVGLLALWELVGIHGLTLPNGWGLGWPLQRCSAPGGLHR